jgi:2-dehydro-3-deoxy-D-arabinonate dehydratase
MKLVKAVAGFNPPFAAIWESDWLIPLSDCQSLSQVFESDDPSLFAQARRDVSRRMPLAAARLLAPIDQQEVWAAGVTYTRSKTARMEESETAASCYDRVYVSDRPELFFKATPHRVSGPNEPLRIREDATWNVPEPELTLVLNSKTELVGFTIGNDMSSRDIEGDNPLYLPQAKVYNQCCGLGPCVTLVDGMPPADQIDIRLRVERAGSTAYEGSTSVSQMARTYDNLIHWLSRDNSFPDGAFLLTTGIVPDSSFTLQPNDIVEISISGIGALTNPIVQGNQP